MTNLLTLTIQQKLIALSTDFFGAIQNTPEEFRYHFLGSLLKNSDWITYEKIQKFIVSFLKD